MIITGPLKTARVLLGCALLAALGLVLRGQVTTDPSLAPGATITPMPFVNGAGTARGALFLTAPAVTAGSGTGITVNNVGEARLVTYKVTVDRTAFVCAAVTCDITIATLPAKTFVTHAILDLTTVFACTAVCTSSTLSMTAGKTAGGTQYLASVDADLATGQFGDAASELGASLTEATIPTTIGDLASWTATTAASLRLTSGTGNIGDGAVTNLSTGSVTVYLTTLVEP